MKSTSRMSILMITTLVLSSIISSAQPIFTGGSPQAITICENSGAYSINTLLKISDPSLGVDTWSSAVAPIHGTLVAAYSTISLGGTITPTGLTYTPSTGYSGSDVFTVNVSNGSVTVSTVINVTITPIPSIISGPATVCTGNNITLTDSATGGTWSSSSSGHASIVASTGIVTGVAQGTTTITYTTGCGTAATFSVTAIATPAAITGATSVCNGANTTLNDASAGGTWSSSNTAIATNAAGVFTGISGGSVTVTYSTGCGTAATYPLTVKIPATAVTGMSSLCVGTTITLSDSITGGTWTSGGTAIATVDPVAGIVTGLTAGAVNIYYTSGCNPNVFKSVTVTTGGPVAITGTASACVGATSTLADATPGGTWSSSNAAIATISSTGVVTGISIGTVTINYSIGCGTNATTTYNVLAVPSVISGVSTVCVGSAITLTDSASYSTWSSNTSWHASIVAGTGVVTGVAQGTATITCTTGCGTAATFLVTAIAAPAAITGATSVCNGANTTLSDASASGSWSSSNTTIATNVAGVFTGVSSGSVIVTYTTGCGTAVTYPLTVKIPATAVTGMSSLCVGTTVTLSDSITGGTWTSGGTSIATVDPVAGIVTGLTAGAVNIYYTSGCNPNVFKSVTVTGSGPAAITGTASSCVGATSTLADATLGGTWSSGNAAIATISSTGVVTGISTGTVTINYAIGCGANTTATYSVIASPSVVSGVSTVCSGSAITLTDSASSGTWSSSSSGHASVSASTGIVTGVAQGTATITYTTGCGTAATFSMTDIDAPVAIITGTTVCTGSNLTLLDASLSGTWASSMTSVATISTGGVLTGISAGTVVATYTTGCGTAASASVVIKSTPTAISGTSTICMALSTTLSEAAVNGTWSSSSSGHATIGTTTGIVTGVAAGTATISYTTGCGTPAVYPVTIVTAPAAITGTTTLCSGTNSPLSDATGSGTWSSSVLSVATINSIGNVQGITAGTTTISYTVGSCPAIASVTVNSAPVAITGGTTVCTGNNTTLADITPGGTWSSSNAAIASNTGNVYTGVTAGTVTATHNTGCGTAATAALTVINPPIITSVSPNIANPGTSITITGSNFNTTAANNIVFFGATQATVLSASATSLTVASPYSATYFPVSVLNNATNLTGFEQYAYLPVFNNAAYIAGVINFNPKVDFSTTSSNAYGVAVGDLDGDGKPDMVVTNNAGASISVYRNTSTSGSITSGSFAAPLTFTTGSGPAYLKIADLNGDGKPDIVVANTTSGTISVFRNKTVGTGINNGSFAAQVTYTVGASPFDIAVADLDGDGMPDLAITNSVGTANTISILRNTASTGAFSTSSFATPVTFVTGSIPVRICAADFDGDGKIDLAVTNNSSNSVSVFRNTSNPGSITASSFATKVDFTTGTNPRGLFVGDIDGDGKPDIIVTNRTTNNISLFRNTATSGSITSSSFATQDTFTAGTSPYDVAMGDMDGDGKPDIIVANYGAATVSVFRNTATTGVLNASSLAAKTDFVTGGTGGPYGVAIDDIDGDSKPDILVANSNSSGSVSVFRNNTLYPLTGTPNVCAGSSVTLSDSAAGGTWSSSATSIASVSSLGSVTGISAGTAVVSYAVTSGYTTATVTVNAIPVVTVTPVSASYCYGSSTSILATGASTYAWSPATGLTASTGATVTCNATATTNYTITGTNAAGCIASSTQTITVTPLASAGTISGSYNICPALTATLSSTVSGGTWSSGATAIATVNTGGIVYGVATGTANISYSYTNSCGTATAYSVITVNPFPSVSVTPTSVTTGGGGPATFIASGATTYLWSPAATLSASTGASVTSTATASTIYTVVGTTNGCSSASTGIINVTLPPTITSVSPASANPGSNITITGTNFNTTAANNIIYFGATQASVYTASATTLTVASPIGATYGPVTVLNNATSLTGFEQYAYLPTFNNSAYIAGAINYNPGVNFTTGLLPAIICVADMDGDGKPDLVVSSQSSSLVSVFRNTSTTGSITAGSFAAKVDFATGASAFCITVGDVDGDGRPDIIVTNGAANTVSVLRNTATSGSITTSSFAAKIDFTTGNTPVGVVLCDIDGDGRPDLLVANKGSNTLSLLHNTGASGSITSTSFAAKVDFATGTTPWYITAGDIDGDGKPDVVVSDNGSNTISVFRNTASTGSITAASLAAKVDFTTGAGPRGLAIGDIDGDGRADISVTNFSGTTVSVFRNTATSGSITAASLAAPASITVGSGPYNISLGDLDGDGKADLSVSNFNSNTFSTIHNTSTSGTITSASFGAAVNYTTGASPYGIATGDLDGDGKPDIVVGNYSSNTMFIFWNNPLQPITGAGTICTQSSLTLSDLTTGGTWSSSATAIASISTGGVVSGLSAGNTVITYSVTGGFTTSTITVTARPTVASITPSATTLCTGTALTLTAGAVTGTGTLTSYNWSGPNGYSTSGLVNTASFTPASTTANGVYSVAVSYSNGCTSTIAITSPSVTVNAIPSVVVTPTSIVTTAGGPVSFVASGAATYSWSPATTLSASTGASVTSTATVTTTYTVTGTTSACSMSATGIFNISLPPVITSVSPAVANPGTSITITGTNFNTIPANNKVFFGATQATVSSATATSLNVALPSGATYAPVSEVNTGINLQAFSQYSFLPKFNNSAYIGGIINYSPKIDFTTDVQPTNICVADIDGDGKPDMIVSYNGTNAVSVYHNTSTSGSITAGSFATKVDFATGSTPYSITVGDIDGDGSPDIIVCNKGSNTVSVLRNMATGSVTSSSFAAKVDFTTGSTPYGVALSDIDGDGRLDIIVVNYGSNTVSVLRNISISGSITTGSFATKVDFTTGTQPEGIAIGDFDGDGKPDIAVNNYSSNTVSVFHNTSIPDTINLASLAAKVDFAVGTSPYRIAAGDLDGDGKPEIATANGTANTVSVLRNTASSGSISASSFASKVDFATGADPVTIAFADLNGDGKTDMAVNNYTSGTVSVFYNTATGGSISAASFAPKVDFATNTNPNSVTIGDLDGDGRPDLVVADQGANLVSVFWNNPLLPVTGTATTCIGSTVTLSDLTSGGTWSSSAVGIASVSATGVVTGITSGTVVVTYSVTGGYTTASVTVNANPSVSAVSTSTTNICSGGTMTLTATAAGVTGGAVYTWTGPGIATTTSSTSPQVFTPSVSTATSAAYSVSVTNTTTGCPSGTSATSSVVAVNPQPSVTLGVAYLVLCSGGSETLTATPSGGAGIAIYTWSGPGIIATTGPLATLSLTPTVSVTSSGAYIVSVAYSGTGCSNAIGFSPSVTINIPPVVGAITGTYTVCPASTVTLSDAGSGTWSSSNTGIATVNTSGTVTGIASGTTSISYAVTNSCGTATTYSVITVNALPSAGVITGTYTLCPTAATTFTVSVSGGVWSSNNVTIASVNTSGAVTGIASGTTAISYAVTNSCGTAAAYSVVTVNALPSAGIITGTYTLCPAATTTLSNGITGGIWSSSNTGIATINTSGVVTGIASGTTTISYAVTNSCGTATTYSVVTVNALPSAGIISGTYTLCPAATTTFTDVVTGGFWSSSNLAIATVNTSGAVRGITSGTTNISYAVTNSCGTATTYSMVTVNASPTAGTISGSSAVCVAATATLTDGISGGTWSSSNTSIATVSTSGIVSGIAAGTTTISYLVTTACGSAGTYTVVTIALQGTWLGIGSTDWNNTANWPCGLIPGTSVNVTIPAGTVYAPIIGSGAAIAKSLTVASGVTLTINGGASIDVKNNLTSNGTITGSGIINLSGTTLQLISGINTIYNLQLNNAAGATINAGDTLKIKGVLTLTSGTLTTNNDLVLMSDSSGNGSIGTITGGAITGNVTIQQYVTGGRRAYRFWAHPFSSAIPLSQMEQYIDITGYLGSTNGFTTTISNAPSAYWYNTIAGNSASGDDPGWTAFSSTNGAGGNAFNKYEGIRLFIRGAKGQGLTGATYTPSAVTISLYGTVNTGAVTMPMVKGTGVNEDYNLLGNPYPSATDIGTVINTAYSAGLVAGAAFYVWDPYMGISGQFITKPISSPYYLGPNESFEIRTATNGNSLHFAESNKAISVSDILMRNAESNYLNLGVYDTAYHLWDILNVNFNDAASDNEDEKYDGAKPSGPAALNFYSLSADNVKLSLDSRPYSAGKVIPLGIRSGYAQDFIIKADKMASSGQVYLYDSYLKSSLLLEQGAEYRFTITTDSLSQGDKRFELRMGNTDTSIIQSATGLAMNVMPNPATDEVTVTYNLQGNSKVSLRLLDMAGITLLEQSLGTTPIGSTKMDMTTIAAGIYMIEITCGEQKIIRRVVKE